MKLSIFHDGQFFVGVVEYQEGFIHKYLKVTFGNEPSDETVLRFITFKLIPLLNQTHGKKKPIQKHKKINPKRLQRKIAKEQKETNLTTFAQQAIKEEQELNKLKSKKLQRLEKERHRQYKRMLKRKKHMKSTKVTNFN
ncbi:YjdF family protein [Staphylococcus epidermidis]|nr:hypothetical protein SEVCU144_0062 [Staphylococcus epidermidis VCU144]MCG1445602.1 YjdF family protein [Staphylococcus epidermidis]MCG1470870.1 YjdF family protein [Staphylococcus epidermidis]MCG1618685.1 YjdF family protein [Staphylococcus epidermidis]